MTTTSIPAIQELRVTVVKNGIIVNTRDRQYSDGAMADSYVFSDVESLAAWLLKQVWAFPGV